MNGSTAEMHVAASQGWFVDEQENLAVGGRHGRVDGIPAIRERSSGGRDDNLVVEAELK